MNKASGGDEIPVELFQILKDDAVKVLHSICQQIWKTQQGLQDWKRSVVFIPIQRKCQRIFKLPHNCTHLTHYQSNAQNSPSQASTVCEPRTSRHLRWIKKRQGNQRSNCQHHWIIEKAIESKKNICLINYTKVFDCVDHNKLENSSRDGNTWPPYLLPEKCVCRSRSSSYNQTWNNRLVQNWERSTSRLYIVTVFIQLICREHHVKCWAGRSTSWKQDC